MMIEFAVEDRQSNGYLALPESATGPAVLVLHAWWGLTPTFTDVCDRLAHEGFVALAPDLYKGHSATTIDAAEALMKSMDGDETYGIISGALSFLNTHPAVYGTGTGVIGFSLGAGWALMLDEPRAVVVFYGTTDPEQITSTAAFQGHFGENDDFEPLEGVQNIETMLQDTGREVQFYIYPDAKHWFFEENMQGYYDAEAARLAWERTVTFLHAKLDRQ